MRVSRIFFSRLPLLCIGRTARRTSFAYLASGFQSVGVRNTSHDWIDIGKTRCHAAAKLGCRQRGRYAAGTRAADAPYLQCRWDRSIEVKCRGRANKSRCVSRHGHRAHVWTNTADSGCSVIFQRPRQSRAKVGFPARPSQAEGRAKESWIPNRCQPFTLDRRDRLLLVAEKP